MQYKYCVSPSLVQYTHGAGVSAPRAATTYGSIRDMGYNCSIASVKPLLNQIKLHFAFRLLESGGKEKLEVQCEVSIVNDDFGSHITRWCWSTVFFLRSNVNTIRRFSSSL